MIPHIDHIASQNTFRALADPTRRDILMMLTEKDMTIGEVVDQFDVTRAAIKKHLVILEEGGLISVHPNGRERINRLELQGLKKVDDWINFFHNFWDDKLDNLKSLIEEENKQNKK